MRLIQKGERRATDRIAATFRAVRQKWIDLSPKRQSAIAAGITVCAIFLGYLVFSEDEPPPRARVYLDFKACLLTGAEGITGGRSAQAWDGMQEASLETRARAQYLQITGPETLGNALPFLTTLAHQGCDLVIAAEELPVKAVLEGAPRFKDTRFVVAGQNNSLANVIAIPVSGSGLAEPVSELVVEAVD